MILDSSLSGLFTSLRESLQNALDGLPEENSVQSQQNGLSLFDVKNELLLSYLHNLTFLILLKLRHTKTQRTKTHDEISKDVVKQLVELRLFLEKGTRPLEARLKYQIDKVIQAADDSLRSNSQGNRSRTDGSHARRNGSTAGASSDSEESDTDIDELSYRPNPRAFQRTAAPAVESKPQQTASGVYKPPRIAATTMPLERSQRNKERRVPGSAVLDEFVANELSNAPIAEPSIGSTIVGGGRSMKTQRERRDEAERKAYEETNFVRLPAETRKDRAKKAGRDNAGFGGEEWRDIDTGLDRIERLTQRKGGKASGLERSRKRPVEDGPRGDGLGIGERFAKRKMMDSKRPRR